MSALRAQILRKHRRRIENRLRIRQWADQPRPMLAARNIHYELSDRDRGLGAGGIGAMLLLARWSGLIQALDARLHLLKVHKPYHESDHVLNIAFNLLAGGDCLEDLESRRTDEAYLDGLGAQRIPDPTTAGDFCRRFDATAVQALMEAINQVRLDLWRRQPKSFFARAVLDADGTLVSTTGQCKEGMDISYQGLWGYHLLLLSLANTGEPLFLLNRSGNRPSHEGAAAYFDQAIQLCRRAGFKRILLRGDTDFTQTRHLDRWDAEGVEFCFGIDAAPNLVQHADSLPEAAWQPLPRTPRYAVKTEPRARPANVKEQVVRQREFENIRLQSEQMAEFAYRPTACAMLYRLVAVRKNLSVEKGEQVLFDDIRYFFYITNDTGATMEEVVQQGHRRCQQENLIAQLKSGVPALNMPVDNLVSNWAYMVMASLAWTLKAWLALSLPETGRWADRHQAQKQSVLKMEFKRFLNAFLRVPCQVVRTGRRVVYRLLAWNPWQPVFLRAVDALRSPV